MACIVKHYVESKITGIYGESTFEEEIYSRKGFIRRNENSFKNGFYIDGFRFYDKKLLMIDGLEFLSEPYNYSPWINKHYFDEVNRVAVLCDDSISIEDYLLELESERQMTLTKGEQYGK